MTEFFSIHLLRRRCAVIALALVTGSIPAEEPSVFTAPKPHPVSRYETRWETNPFMLKTTPVVVQNASFAEHLVIASVYGHLADPTVVLVNVKTHERIRLRTSQAAGNGIKLDRLHRGAGRRCDMLAIVSQGAETSEVHFGTDYFKQVAAAETARTTQSVLQKRQQSLSQHSGSVALPPAAMQKQGAGGSGFSPDVIPGSAPRQDAWLVAASFNSSGAGNPRGGQAGSSNNDNHSSTPSLAEDLSGATHMTLRRYTFRMGDELSVPHPDPQ